MSVVNGEGGSGDGGSGGDGDAMRSARIEARTFERIKKRLK